jgi:tetratricopeptide (TPR) repeat protein
MKGFSETGEYRFRMAAGDIRIDQARRQVTETERGIEQAREQAPPGASPDEAVAPLAARLTEARKHLLDLQAGEYRQRAEKYPTDRALRFRLGEAEFELGNIADAMACFQSAKDEPKFKVRSGHLLGRCFASESWHVEAIGEYKEALAALDATEKERELAIRYDLMVSLLAHARAENSVDLAREALEICSSIARKDITFRDIRDRRREVDTLLKELSGGG